MHSGFWSCACKQTFSVYIINSQYPNINTVSIINILTFTYLVSFLSFIVQGIWCYIWKARLVIIGRTINSIIHASQLTLYRKIPSVIENMYTAHVWLYRGNEQASTDQCALVELIPQIHFLPASASFESGNIGLLPTVGCDCGCCPSPPEQVLLSLCLKLVSLWTSCRDHSSHFSQSHSPCSFSYSMAELSWGIQTQGVVRVRHTLCSWFFCAQSPRVRRRNYLLVLGSFWVAPWRALRASGP